MKKKKSKKSISRRGFLKKTAVTTAGITIVPRFVLGGNGYTPPSDQLTKAIIGTGQMGMNHIPYEDTRVVALCDVDKKHLKEAAGKVGGNVKTFHDYRELLELPEVDVVHIATPPHWHGIMSVDAANAGKDVWCEKPMTHTIGEGQKVVEAVQRNGRMFRLNTWFRFKDDFYGMGTEVKPIKKLVENKLLGWPLTVTVGKLTGFDWKFYWVGKDHLETEPVPDELDYDFWLGPAQYKPYSTHRVHQTFRGYWDYDGGGLADMGQHYIDPIQYFLGKDDTSPISVEIDAPQQHPDAVGTWRRIEFTYEDGCKIVLDGEGTEDVPYIAGPEGNLYKDFKSDVPNLKDKIAELPDPKPVVKEFSESVKTRKKFALNEENGHRSCTLVNMALTALRLGRSLKFDPEKQEFIDDEAANRMIMPKMRAPWTI